jgi:hypothetical protein
LAHHHAHDLSCARGGIQTIPSIRRTPILDSTRSSLRSRALTCAGIRWNVALQRNSRRVPYTFPSRQSPKRRKGISLRPVMVTRVTTCLSHEHRV